MNDVLFGMGIESSDDESQAPFPNVINTRLSNLVSEDEQEGNNAENNNNNNVNEENHNGGADDDSDDDEYWSIDNELHTGSSVNVPSLSKWKEVDLFEPITVTVGKAKRNIWVQAMEEIDLIKKNLSDLQLPMDVAGLAASPLLKVYHTLFGASSLLCSNFCRQVKTTKLHYLHFMFTYYLSCKNQQTVGSMHESMEINSDFLMPNKKYNKIWTDIKKQEGNTKQIEFWKILEDTTNRQLKLLFMSAEKGFPYLLGFDDDKIHFDYSNKTKMNGLSKQHHVKDNRKGLTLHTCAFSATCVPVAVSFQRYGESVQDTYVRSMTDLFGQIPGGCPNLVGATLASDRGYWEKGLLFGQVLEGGGNVIGTVKRVSRSWLVVVCLFFFFYSHLFFQVRLVSTDVRSCRQFTIPR